MSDNTLLQSKASKGGLRRTRGQSLRVPVLWQDVSFQCVITYAGSSDQLGRMSASSEAAAVRMINLRSASTPIMPALSEQSA